MDKTGLEEVIRTEHGNISGIVALQKGVPIYENYFNGYGAASAVHVMSVTKSVLSALVGIAIERGHIQSVEQKVLDFFPEYPAPAGDPRREVTL